MIFVTVIACAALGYGVGSFLPGLIARLAGRDPAEASKAGEGRIYGQPAGGTAEPATRTRRLGLVESVTAVVFGVLAARVGPQADLPAFLYLGAVGVALAFIDIEVRRLPNPLTLPSYPVAGVLLGVAALAQHAGGAYLRALAGMVALYLFYLLLIFVHPAGMGFGDVKLAGVLGLYLGWLGWGTLVAGAFLGFLFGGLTGVALMVAGRATRKSTLPFGPYMLLGAFAAVVWGQWLTEVYLDHLGV